MNEADTSTVG